MKPRYLIPTLAILLGLSAVPTLALARKLITTQAGCNQEFRKEKGTKLACNACIKDKKKFKQNQKGIWLCVDKASALDGAMTPAR